MKLRPSFAWRRRRSCRCRRTDRAPRRPVWEASQHAVAAGLRLLRRMHLLSVAVLQALAARAERQPVGAHLQVFVEDLQGVVVEGGLASGRTSPPRSWSRGHSGNGCRGNSASGSTSARHVVQDPEAEILQDRADAEDVVVGADHPDRAVRLQHAAHGQQPGTGEGVIGVEAFELVPVVVARVDLRLVRPVQVAAELQIVGRIGEDQVDGPGRQGSAH
jgi:hypothetical protein